MIALERGLGAIDVCVHAFADVLVAGTRDGCGQAQQDLGSFVFAVQTGEAGDGIGAIDKGADASLATRIDDAYAQLAQRRAHAWCASRIIFVAAFAHAHAGARLAAVSSEIALMIDP